jgi:uncharacterized protein YqeY
MAGTEDRVRDDLKSAMRARDSLRAQTLRAILAAAKNRAIDLHVDALPEAEFLAVVKKEGKQRAEALEFAQKASRDDLVREHTATLAIVEGYLPRQMTEAELRAEIREIIASGADGVGPIMKELTKRHAGLFDGKTASRVAGEALKG